ncbi:MAG: indole-3-glycerol phosphate synthase TrpC [Alphaproteobacteria bacterium]|nr:indole-3-glycerol phosphate synthase TrpC [Alphaproteobacteria bacterium]
MTILDKIAAYKREEIAAAKARMPLAELESRIKNLGPARGFAQALRERRARGEIGLIAEIKKASPSKGIIRRDFEPAALARAYAQGGAACLSVLTDSPSFQGDLAYIPLVRRTVELPILRKDFMLDPYQVAEARAFGADCILIIMAMVGDAAALELADAAKAYGMDALVEIHEGTELDRALRLGAVMVGINNRDLRTFQTDLNVTMRLAPTIPSDVLVVAESGLSSRADLDRLSQVEVTTFLVGESLMRQTDVAAATRALVHGELGTASPA